MSVFLILLGTGLLGMLVMALPGLFHANGGVGHATGSHVSHIGDGGHEVAHILGGAKAGNSHNTAHGTGKLGAKLTGKETGQQWSRLIPNPRVIFSLLTSVGAFGYGFEQLGKLSVPLALLAALVPALALEKFAITPLWNWMLTFAGNPASSLETVTLAQAEAITDFRNGRGMVSVEHDGRMIQLRAELKEDQRNLQIKVGETLRIESVNEAQERCTVSLR